MTMSLAKLDYTTYAEESSGQYSPVPDSFTEGDEHKETGIHNLIKTSPNNKTNRR